MKAIAEFIYEATRLEAEWSNRSIVAEKWDKRDEKFRKQFVNIIETYFKKDKLPTPEEAHDSWVRAYEKMGWVYGKKRDAIKKTHPDILPFDELPKDERDKDSIFLVFVWLAKQITMTQLNKPKTGKDRLTELKKDYADFNSKMQDDFLPKDACVALGIKDKWDGQFTARSGAEMFYEYLRQQLVEEMKQ